MFRNKRKTIGLLVSDHFEATQARLCEGVVSRARELNMNVAIFSLYASYGAEAFGPSEMNLLNLIDSEQLDGLIVAPRTDAFSEKELALVKDLCDRITCPVISINEDFGFIPCVVINNYSLLEEVIEHFVTVHGFTRIDFLSGRPDMAIAQERLQCYIDCMKRHGIYDERRIFHGDFWRIKAIESVEYFLSLEEELPQAIVCANDHTAMVVCHELERRGISVPEQIAVSGCDNMKEAFTFSPPLTTVDFSHHSMGILAVDRIMDMLRGETIPHKSFCPHETIYRGSCTCNAHSERELTFLRQTLSDERIRKHITSNRVMFLSVELQSAPSLENLYQQVADYLIWGNSLAGFSICLSDDWRERGKQEESFGFSEKLKADLAIYNGRILKPEVFSRKQMLPTIMLADKPLAYYFSSLHYRNRCYGYIAFNYEDAFARSNDWHLFLVNFTNALEAFRVRDELQHAVTELNTLYIQDALTGLMNRRGFLLRSQEMFDRAREEHLSLFSFSADLDSLKYINDTFGHAQGDIALKRIADALLAASQNNEVCARVGGDEYSVFGLGLTQRDAENFARDFLSTLERLNRNNPKDHPASASWGYVLYHDVSKFTLEEIIRATDERMYQMKIDHKNNLN